MLNHLYVLAGCENGYVLTDWRERKFYGFKSLNATVNFLLELIGKLKYADWNPPHAHKVRVGEPGKPNPFLKFEVRFLDNRMLLVCGVHYTQQERLVPTHLIPLESGWESELADRISKWFSQNQTKEEK